MTFSAALFDMDGLLVDSERTIMNTWIDVSNAHGVTLTEIDYLQIVGRSFAEGQVILARLIGDTDTFDAVRLLVREQLAAPEPHPKFPLKAGALALLETLAQAGIPCAVASSSARDVIRARLDAVGVLPFFRAIAGGDEVARGKPDPAVYGSRPSASACRRTRASRSRTATSARCRPPAPAHRSSPCPT